MFRSRGQKIVNLLSAIIVLIGGFYIIFFMPIALSLLTRLIIGVLLVIYFLWRLNYFIRNSSEKVKDPLGRGPRE
jgi:hypothetical protein